LKKKLIFLVLKNNNIKMDVPHNYKTVLCKHFEKGHCDKGDSCQYIHKRPNFDISRNAKATFDRMNNALKIAEELEAANAKAFKASFEAYKLSEKNTEALRKSCEEAKALLVKAQPKPIKKLTIGDESSSTTSFDDMMDQAKFLTFDN
jgi:hypothetical protein